MSTDEIENRALLRQLVEQYARAADERDDEMYADVFTEDGFLATGRRDIVGREQLLDVANRLSRYRVTTHFIGNHYVDFADDENATGSVYCVASHVYDKDGAERVYVMNIRYDDLYRRTDRWRISQRRLTLLWDEDRPTGSRYE